MLAKIIDDVVVQYPYTMAQLQQENPNTSFPSDFEYDLNSMADFNVYHVYTQIAPSFDKANQKIEEGLPVKINGRWNQKWNIEPLTAQERYVLYESKAAEVRTERNNKLMATDWTQLKDVSPAVSAQWVAYREQLRNIPAQAGFPWNITWPSPPS